MGAEVDKFTLYAIAFELPPETADPYTLLGLAVYTSDKTLIAAAVEERWKILQDFQNFGDGEATRIVESEVLAAKELLLDDVKRSEVDASLKASGVKAPILKNNSIAPKTDERKNQASDESRRDSSSSDSKWLEFAPTNKVDPGNHPVANQAKNSSAAGIERWATGQFNECEFEQALVVLDAVSDDMMTPALGELRMNCDFLKGERQKVLQQFDKPRGSIVDDFQRIKNAVKEYETWLLSFSLVDEQVQTKWLSWIEAFKKPQESVPHSRAPILLAAAMVLVVLAIAKVVLFNENPYSEQIAAARNRNNWRKVLRLDSDNAWALISRAQHKLDQQSPQVDSAINDLKRAQESNSSAELSSTFAEAYILATEQRIKSGQLVAAKEALQKSKSFGESTPKLTAVQRALADSFLHLAVVQADANRIDKANVWLAKARGLGGTVESLVATNNSLAKAHIRRADKLLANEDKDQALVEIDKARSLDPRVKMTPAIARLEFRLTFLKWNKYIKDNSAESVKLEFVLAEYHRVISLGIDKQQLVSESRALARTLQSRCRQFISARNVVPAERDYRMLLALDSQAAQDLTKDFTKLPTPLWEHLSIELRKSTETQAKRIAAEAAQDQDRAIRQAISTNDLSIVVDMLGAIPTKQQIEYVPDVTKQLSRLIEDVFRRRGSPGTVQAINQLTSLAAFQNSEFKAQVSIALTQLPANWKATLPKILLTPQTAKFPFDERTAKAHQEAYSHFLNVPVESKNSIGMKFVLIPPGEFNRRDSGTDAEFQVVVISKPFEIGTNEVTKEQYRRLMKNDSKFGGPLRPAGRVAWSEATEFCRSLNRKSSEKTAGYRYRLPTEAEWEFACRAGSDTEFSFGDIGQITDNVWFRSNSEGTTQIVGTKKPNSWGLFEMHGNVAEWCEDWYGDYPQEKTIDPTGPEGGDSRVIRGGSFTTLPTSSADRRYVDPISLRESIGFRIIRTKNYQSDTR
jgi:formylglycine-generating enzyme required for sulfatase activity